MGVVSWNRVLARIVRIPSNDERLPALCVPFPGVGTILRAIRIRSDRAQRSIFPLSVRVRTRISGYRKFETRVGKEIHC